MTKEQNTTRYFTYLALSTITLLMIPLIAMQFSVEVNWTLSDFTFAGLMIFGTGSAYKLITLKSQELSFRMALGIALASSFLLIWANGAVGIIGSENNTFNLYYYLVILLGIIGAFASRFKSQGFAYTMFVMAVAQAILMTTALYLGMESMPGSSISEIIGVNTFFILLFVISGLLFQYVANTFTNNELEENQP